MTPESGDLTVLLGRLRDGEPAARDLLLRKTQGRLERLARKMLRQFPTVSRWADAEDVFQNASLRLLRALESASVQDTRQFLSLAAAVIRRELIDLARHFQGPHGVGANHASHNGDAPDQNALEAELDLWTALHEAVERLTPELREVFVLTFYHKWSQAEIAELFHIDERTVRRRWKSALAQLSDLIGGKFPTV